MQRYLGVRGLTGALLTGLGEISAYLAHNLKTDTERLKFLSARYPDMPVDNVLEAANYAADLVATAEIIESGITVDLPALPPDYPMAPSAIHYSVEIRVPGVTGTTKIPNYYTRVDSAVPLSVGDLKSKLKLQAADAAANYSGRSKWYRDLFNVAVEASAADNLDITILSVWQS